MIREVGIKAHNFREAKDVLFDKYNVKEILKVRRKFLRILFSGYRRIGYLYIYRVKFEEKKKNDRCEECNCIIKGKPAWCGGRKLCQECFDIEISM